ncbi:AI-2E family transporter [Frisingicoccus caecimuris]|uniref:Putative PurR-regulated permease PerM n=1 Tax=Frisingicoccus caecimuris TaxID=1796636 RepID=A0A4R2LCZ3_9FIRM|nr:AI-2E family transporter [Frisingicoccus caecimuris]MCR1918414.1 AI-2E family transporter [Frisingicoccus caecimuris]TCO85061.1 putative PurR-regulated permease PerM [Frisingicoccus caecimuris]
MDEPQKQPKRKKRFESNNTYFTICIYAIATFAICLLIFRFTSNWQSTKNQIGQILSVFSPFLLAFLIAYFTNPMVKHIDNFLFQKTLKHRFERGHLLLSMILAYVIAIGAIILVFIFIVPQIINSISQLVRISPTLYQNALDMLYSLDERFPTLDLSFIYQAAEDVMPDLFNFFRTFMSDTVLPFLYNAGLSIISWFINIILAFVISCYLLFSKQKLIKSLKRVAYAIFPEDICLTLFDTLKDCNQIFSQYIIGKTLDSTIIGILCLACMTILKLPYALIISLIVGITNMIPYFGPFIGAVPGILILLIISPKSSLIFAVLILAIQQLDGSVIGPKILGKSTGLQPISIIFAITVGGALAGPLGMFLGVPIVAVLTFLINKLINYILKKKHIEPDLSNTKDSRTSERSSNDPFIDEFEESDPND